MNKDILLYFALLLWFVVPVSAQPTIFVPSQSVDPNASVIVDIKVADFEELVSMQFSINWNQDVLQFDSVGNLNVLSDYSLANFGTNVSHLGKLTTYWVDNQFTGVTLDDSTTIFSLYFKAIGTEESFSVVAITDDPIFIEFSDIDGNILPVITEDGMITIVGPLSTDPSPSIQSNELFTLYQNQPNPFDNQSIIRFDISRSSEIEFRFYDINGKLIYSFKDSFLEGENSITINADKLPGSGTYFYTLQTNDYSLTNKMVLVR